MPLSLELPIVQKWSCHSCTDCCRHHLVEVSDEERLRIQKQGWAASGEIGEARPVVPISRWSSRWRLNHTAEGACVFLNEQGLCRIHAKFGEGAKPLACRVYPYAFAPAGGEKVAVSLRYNCPSVVANRGATAQEALTSIRKIARDVVPADRRDIPPPAVSASAQFDWPMTKRIVSYLEADFSASSDGFLRTLLGTIFWVSLVNQAKFDKLDDEQIEEFLSLVRPAAAAEVPRDLSEFSEPSRAGRLMFRSIVGQYARLETVSDLDHPWRARVRNVRDLVRMNWGTGTLPAFRPALDRVPFAQLEQPFGWPAAADELFTRYLRTKIRGMHFCGRAFGDWPVTDGFFALVMVVPVTLYLARWLAAGAGRMELIDEDLAGALAMVDHHHGYSPGLENATARRRVRLLAQGDLPKLCVWYAR